MCNHVKKWVDDECQSTVFMLLLDFHLSGDIWDSKDYSSLLNVPKFLCRYMVVIYTDSVTFYYTHPYWCFMAEINNWRWKKPKNSLRTHLVELMVKTNRDGLGCISAYLKHELLIWIEMTWIIVSSNML